MLDVLFKRDGKISKTASFSSLASISVCIIVLFWVFTGKLTPDHFWELMGWLGLEGTRYSVDKAVDRRAAAKQGGQEDAKRRAEQ